MFILRRYVLREILQVFLVTLSLTTLLFTFFGGIREGLKQGMPLGAVLQLMPFVLPDMLRFTTPASSLFAVCTVFGRLSANNEIGALKSLGVHPLEIIRPVLVFFTLISIGTYALYEVSAVWCKPGVVRTITNSLERIVYGALASQRTFRASGFEILVKRIDGRKMISPMIVLNGNDEKRKTTILVEEAELNRTPDGEGLLLSCRNGTIEAPGKATLRFSDTIEQELPLSEGRGGGIRASGLAQRDIPKYRKQAFDELRNVTELLKNGQGDPKLLEEIKHNQQELVYSLDAEVPRRMANGFSCISFAFIGIPAAMVTRHRDTLAVFFVCFMPILIVYYPLFVVGEMSAKSGALPPLFIWFSNAVLTTCGLWLLGRAMRY